MRGDKIIIGLKVCQKGLIESETKTTMLNIKKKNPVIHKTIALSCPFNLEELISSFRLIRIGVTERVITLKRLPLNILTILKE